jgi:hypothetical protein
MSSNKIDEIEACAHTPTKRLASTRSQAFNAIIFFHKKTLAWS